MPSEETQAFIKQAVKATFAETCSTHFAKWNVAYLKYSALLATGMAAEGIEFFHTAKFLWNDWAIFVCKLVAVFGAVTAAFIDQTYGSIKHGDTDPTTNQPYKVS